MYLTSEVERQEYVLSQDGLIYRGRPKHITTLPWTFGQVEYFSVFYPKYHSFEMVVDQWIRHWTVVLKVVSSNHRTTKLPP